MKVASVKLEGRTKSSAYLAQVVDAYKTALTDITKGEFKPEKYLSELVNAASRPLTTGFSTRTGAEPSPCRRTSPNARFWPAFLNRLMKGNGWSRPKRAGQPIRTSN